MSQNGQTHFKNLAVNAERFLRCVRPFWDNMYERVNPKIPGAHKMIKHTLKIFQHLLQDF